MQKGSKNMRQRVRPRWSDKELREIYSKPHDHNNWHDHLIRVEATKQVAKWMFDSEIINNSVADLSCGNGEIARYLNADRTFLGDFAPGYEYFGPIERTLDEIPDVDLFVCSETLEHLDDPDLVLKKIRAKTEKILISTPLDNWDDPNAEHYWAWGKTDIEAMLRLAGFQPEIYMCIELPHYLYNYQIWGCR